MLTKTQGILVDQFLAEYWDEFVALCESHGEDADVISEALTKSQCST